jgi:transketolase
MRKEFAAWVEAYGLANPKFVMLTGDLGFQALEGVRAKLGDRFVNAGVSEQNMISVAAAMASEGLEPLCYSIAPFAVFRPAEQIRLDICLHGLNVKVVGNGGGYGYGIMGSTHHAIEDVGMLSSFQQMACFVPMTGADVSVTCNAMMAYQGPSYLRLNMGTLPEGFSLPEHFSPIRRVRNTTPSAAKLTVIGLGPVLLNAINGKMGAPADYFVVSEVPVRALSAELVESVKQTGKVVIVEEHVERSGLAEHLALAFLKAGLAPRIWTRAALGYPSKTYGSQSFHQKESGLDAASLGTLIEECLT